MKFLRNVNYFIFINHFLSFLKDNNHFTKFFPLISLILLKNFHFALNYHIFQLNFDLINYKIYLFIFDLKKKFSKNVISLKFNLNHLK